MFEPHGGDYDRIYYIDYSQIELRSQANYTLLVSGGDLNLCRAYMPFKCHRIGENGEKIPYEFQSPAKRDEWDQYIWYLDERPNEEWKPTDVHGETTHNALMALGYTCHKKYEHYTKDEACTFYEAVEKENPSSIIVDASIFQKMRGKGKIFNFMKNYGGGLGAAISQLEISEEVAQALIDGYAEAFPEVVTYQNMITKAHARKGFIENMYGRRYYLKDNGIAYKLANYNIQGTCADMLKEKIIEVDKYLADKKSLFQMNIHDELSFLVHKDERHIIKDLVQIMEKFDWHLVPIVADVEYTETNWAEKIETEVE